MPGYTKGYTVAKRNAHMVTAAVIAVLGLILIVPAYQGRNLKTVAYVVGAILVIVGLLAMIPIWRRPTEEGVWVETDEDCYWSGSKDCNAC